MLFDFTTHILPKKVLFKHLKVGINFLKGMVTSFNLAGNTYKNERIKIISSYPILTNKDARSIKKDCQNINRDLNYALERDLRQKIKEREYNEQE